MRDPGRTAGQKKSPVSRFLPRNGAEAAIVSTPTGSRRNPVFCEKTGSAERRRCRIRCSWGRNVPVDQPAGFLIPRPARTSARNSPSEELRTPRQHVSTSARQHVSTSARQHVSTSARQHVSTSARQHVSTSAEKGPAETHGTRQAADQRLLAGAVLNRGQSSVSRASVAVEAGRFISMITSLSNPHPRPRRPPHRVPLHTHVGVLDFFRILIAAI
jgi:hypothetical protein